MFSFCSGLCCAFLLEFLQLEKLRLGCAPPEVEGLAVTWDSELSPECQPRRHGPVDRNGPPHHAGGSFAYLGVIYQGPRIRRMALSHWRRRECR
jgi:hypothetical protein